MEDFRISLAAARVNANMTQEEVAKAMQVSKNTIISWEKYKTEPTVTQSIRLCELYNIPSQYVDMVGPS